MEGIWPAGMGKVCSTGVEIYFVTSDMFGQHN